MTKRFISIIFPSLFLLSACGGGGGGGESPSKSSPSSASQSSSSAASSQAAVAWIDSGAFESDPLILREEDDTLAQSIERLKANGESLNLTKKMPLRGRIAEIKISPDGAKVAYLADQETDNIYELFVSNSDGSVNLKVSAAITEGDITDFSWSDDSNYIIYFHDSRIYELRGSYIAKFDGTKSSKITYKSTAGQDPAFVVWPRFMHGTSHYQFIAWDFTEQPRMVVVNPVTGEKSTEVPFDNKFEHGHRSLNGNYLITETFEPGQEHLYITDLSNNQTTEIYSGETVEYYWSVSGTKIALFNFYNLTIYDTEEKSFSSLMTYEYGDISSILLKDFWYKNDEYLVFQSYGVHGVLSVPTSGATPIHFKEFLAPMEFITSHDVSADGKLIVFTDNHRVLTRNLDGSNLEDHTWLQSEGGLTKGMWLPDNKSALAQRYDINTNKNVLTKIDFEKKTLTSLSGDKTVNCFLVAKSTKSYCILFFDE